jgi:hypothetical protein
MMSHTSWNHLRTTARFRWVTNSGRKPGYRSCTVRLTCTADGSAAVPQPSQAPSGRTLLPHPLRIPAARATAAIASILAMRTAI